ncbi:unnamed protein product [Lampetra planeri]
MRASQLVLEIVRQALCLQSRDPSARRSQREEREGWTEKGKSGVDGRHKRRSQSRREGDGESERPSRAPHFKEPCASTSRRQM